MTQMYKYEFYAAPLPMWQHLSQLRKTRSFLKFWIGSTCMIWRWSRYLCLNNSVSQYMQSFQLMTFMHSDNLFDSTVCPWYAPPWLPCRWISFACHPAIPLRIFMDASFNNFFLPSALLRWVDKSRVACDGWETEPFLSRLFFLLSLDRMDPSSLERLPWWLLSSLDRRAMLSETNISVSSMPESVS